MTKTDFLKEWGGDYRKLAAKPMFASLLGCIDDEGPARQIAGRSDADVLHGGSVLAADIRGYERLRNLLVSLAAVPEKEFEPPDTFKEEEAI